MNRQVPRLRATALRLANVAGVLERGLRERAVADSVGLDDLTAGTPLRPRPMRINRTHDPKAVVLFGHLDLRQLYGGMVTAFVAAASLSVALDVGLRVVCTGGYSVGTPDDVRRVLSTAGVQEPAAIEVVNALDRSQPIALADDDILVASSWTDAYLIGQLERRQPWVYLVQDFEPGFYPAGDAYAAARSTYELRDAIHVFNTSVLRDHFKAEGIGAPLWAAHFEPAIARRASSTEKAQRLFLYGRPSVERNLYLTSLLALDRVASVGGLTGWQVVAAGETGHPDVLLSRGVRVRQLGLLPIDEYRSFIDGVAIALTPMLAPHPNYPTLELAGRGARVVTTAFGRKTDLSRYGTGISVVPALVPSISDAVMLAIEKQGAPGTLSALVPDKWPDALEATLRTLSAQFLT